MCEPSPECKVDTRLRASEQVVVQQQEIPLEVIKEVTKEVLVEVDANKKSVKHAGSGLTSAIPAVHSFSSGADEILSEATAAPPTTAASPAACAIQSTMTCRMVAASLVSPAAQDVAATSAGSAATPAAAVSSLVTMHQVEAVSLPASPPASSSAVSQVRLYLGDKLDYFIMSSIILIIFLLWYSVATHLISLKTRNILFWASLLFDYTIVSLNNTLKLVRSIE
jgi:hypothetical protein